MRHSTGAVNLGEHVPSLARWGRSPDADLLYRTLVAFGPRSRRTLAQDLGLPVRRVAAALDELASIGAAMAHRTTARGAEVWTPTEPREVMRRVRPADQPWDQRQSLIDRLVADAMTLGDGLRHLRTRALTRARLAELVEAARHEHLAMNTEAAFDAESARAAVPTDRALLRRGVRMRVLGRQPAYPDPMVEYGRQPAEASPDYREAPVVPMKLFVVDRRVALFPVDPNDFERGYLEVAQPPLVSALLAMFEKHWADSQEPREPAVPHPLGPREHALVTLLAQGHTDASAARELRISARSVSNIMRALMDEFGADNRFQLGLILGDRHLVSPPAKPDQERP